MRVRIFFLVCLVNYVSFLQGMTNPESTLYQFVKNLVENNSTLAEFYHNEFYEKATVLWGKVKQECTPEERKRFDDYFNNALYSLNKQSSGLLTSPTSEDKIPLTLVQTVEEAAIAFNISIGRISRNTIMQLTGKTKWGEIVNIDAIKMNSFLDLNNNFYHKLDINLPILRDMSPNESRGMIYHECAHASSQDVVRRAALMYACNTNNYTDLLKENTYLRELYELEEYYADTKAVLSSLKSAFDITSLLFPYRSELSFTETSNPSPPLALRYLKATMLADKLKLEKAMRKKDGKNNFLDKCST
ncbi:MAG: hypothetical protein WA432_03110 [Candidatus Babeliaceae bacterium]